MSKPSRDWETLSMNRDKHIQDARPFAEAPTTAEEWSDENWAAFDAKYNVEHDYRVTLRVSGELTITVSARDEEHAIEIANDQASNDDFDLENDYAFAELLPDQPPQPPEGQEEIAWPRT